MTDTCLSDQCIEPNLINTFYKMIYEPFYELSNENYRVFSGSREDLENILENKIQNKLLKLNSSDNSDKNSGNKYLIKKNVNTKDYKIFEFPIFEKGESSLHLMGGDTWFLNDIQKDYNMDYNLAAVSYLLNNNKKMTPEEDYKFFNSYNNLVHNIMNETERQHVKNLFINRSSLIHSQLKGGSNQKSNIYYINSYRYNNFHKKHEIKELSYNITN